MASESELDEARGEAHVILGLGDEEVAKLFFERTMRRNLARTVRHLDKLIRSGGDDRKLGETALERLGFAAET